MGNNELLLFSATNEETLTSSSYITSVTQLTYPPSQDIEKSPETRRMTRQKGKIEERWSLCPLHQSTDEDWGSLEQAGEKEVISCIYISAYNSQYHE